MNVKIMIAFAAGAVIASGIVYVAVAPDQAAPPVSVAAVQPKAVETPPASQIDPPPPVIPAPVEVHKPSTPAAEEPVAAPPAPAPVREKPSPLRPPARREIAVRRADPRVARRADPVIVARSEPPKVQQPAPPPAPTPVPDPPLPPVAVPPALAPQPEAPAPPSQAPPVQVPQTRTPNTVTIQPGTILAVRIGETISAVRNEVGDDFLATLDRPLVIDGFVIAERGARVEGRVVEAQRPGRTNGSSHLGVEIIELATSDGQRIRVRTATFKKENSSFAGSDWANVAMTRGKAAEIPVDTRMSFRIQEPIRLTERLH